MTSKQKCTEHAQATLPRLRELTFGQILSLNINHIEPYEAKGKLCSVNDWSDYGDYDHYRKTEERKTIKAAWYRGDDHVISEFTPDNYKIIGHTPTLGDWLELLGEKNIVLLDVVDGGKTAKLSVGDTYVTFELSTNEPDNWDTLAELLNL